MNKCKCIVLFMSFFLRNSIDCSVYVAANIAFTYFAPAMLPCKFDFQKKIFSDCLVNISEETFSVDVQCNVIDNKAGTLRLKIKPENYLDEKGIEAIIFLDWGKPVKYKNDYMNVSCLVYKLSGK